MTPGYKNCAAPRVVGKMRDPHNVLGPMFDRLNKLRQKERKKMGDGITHGSYGSDKISATTVKDSRKAHLAKVKEIAFQLKEAEDALVTLKQQVVYKQSEVARLEQELDKLITY